MPKPLPTETQDSIRSMLLNGASYSQVIETYPKVSKSTISRYASKLQKSRVQASAGRPSKVSPSTQRKLARSFRTGVITNPRGALEELSKVGVTMTKSGVKKLLNRRGIKAKVQRKTNLVRKSNQKARLEWAMRHRHLQ